MQVSIARTYPLICRLVLFFTVYWRTLQQCRSRTYVSVIRRKWIRLRKEEKTDSRFKFQKSRAHARADGVVYSCGKRVSPSSFPSFHLLCIYFSLIFIHLSICLSAFRSPIIFTPTRPSLLLSPLIFLLFTCVFQFRSLRPVVVFTRLSLSTNDCTSIALTRFSRIRQKMRILEETMQRRDYETICERRHFLPTVLTPQ